MNGQNLLTFDHIKMIYFLSTYSAALKWQSVCKWHLKLQETGRQFEQLMTEIYAELKYLEHKSTWLFYLSYFQIFRVFTLFDGQH